MKDKTRVVASVVFVVLVLVFSIFYAIKWYSAPCEEFKTDNLLAIGYAPARCVR